mmetsp:Transcript_78087/g.181158  ORF Transcript_78087/g.181158 Transcript_78087/m.181158 type:complete len:231 (-) Transcript_78087:132-824(-)
MLPKQCAGVTSAGHCLKELSRGCGICLGCRGGHAASAKARGLQAELSQEEVWGDCALLPPPHCILFGCSSYVLADEPVPVFQHVVDGCYDSLGRWQDKGGETPDHPTHLSPTDSQRPTARIDNQLAVENLGTLHNTSGHLEFDQAVQQKQHAAHLSGGVGRKGKPRRPSTCAGRVRGRVNDLGPPPAPAKVCRRHLPIDFEGMPAIPRHRCKFCGDVGPLCVEGAVVTVV